MNGLNRFVPILLVISSAAFPQRGNGDQVGGYPTFYERQLLVLTNACRMAPAQFRERYIGDYQVLLPQNYAPVKPLYWNLALNHSSRAHAMDMANNCGLQHNSCDGTDFATRVKSYYLNKNSQSYTFGENISTGTATAIATLKLWVLEVDPSSSPVPADLSGNDAHRQNLMRTEFRELGCGYAYGPEQWYSFWVQDFGTCGHPTFSGPLVSGSHFFITPDSITFLVNYYSALPPDNLKCTIDSVDFPMIIAMGTASRGTYALTLKTDMDVRQYFFSCSGGRYPEYGMLLTIEEGNGTSDYIPPESIGVTSVPSNDTRLPSEGF